MKLNKIQIDALASKITKELNEENNSKIREHNENIENSDEYINFETKNEDCIYIMNLKKKYKGIDSYYFERICYNIKGIYFKNKFKKEVKEVWKGDVYDSIVLNTIECDNIDDITAKIKAEFKSKK